MPDADSLVKTMKRFQSFWSNVSAIKIGRDVPAETQAAIIRGMDRAHEKEEQGREAE